MNNFSTEDFSKLNLIYDEHNRKLINDRSKKL